MICGLIVPKKASAATIMEDEDESLHRWRVFASLVILCIFPSFNDAQAVKRADGLGCPFVREIRIRHAPPPVTGEGLF